MFFCCCNLFRKLYMFLMRYYRYNRLCSMQCAIHVCVCLYVQYHYDTDKYDPQPFTQTWIKFFYGVSSIYYYFAIALSFSPFLSLSFIFCSVRFGCSFSLFFFCWHDYYCYCFAVTAMLPQLFFCHSFKLCGQIKNNESL